ncbi:GNAT family acetyltransferase [Sphingomonas spermidinifaciens]|uniref:GNAT family acetyltransferase n=1 Tax=Sphingomonas spermidinifaciens TaxID=1141889 RepID=A0A2A4B3V6_9SPHN|nr:GNAT family acetyltransferase [Sphingomonas spermidinifaciens]PCD03121.1 GNAT family acetyltransferase [Sphingomonas spermidinifaciens]
MIRPFEAGDMAGLDALWRTCFPDDPPRNAAPVSVPEKLRVEPGSVLVAEDAGRIVGSIMHGYDGHRGWLWGVAVAPSHRGQGLGAALVRAAEAALAARGCLKVNLQVRKGNAAVTAFYERLGYTIEPRISMGKLL